MAIPFRLSLADQAKHETEWAVRLAKLDLPALTAGQQLALFRLRKSGLCELIVAALERSTVRASAADYTELMNRGWLRRNRATSLHKITVLGSNRADQLAKLAARDLGVHFFLTYGTRYQQFITCTCGKFTYHHNRNEGHERTAFARRSAEHLVAVGQRSAGMMAGSPPSAVPASERVEKEIGG